MSRLKIVPDKKPPPAPVKLDDLVGYYRSVDAEIDEVEARHIHELKPLQDMKEELTGLILAALDANGVDSARTDQGTATSSIKYSANCKADPDAFMEFVIANEQWDLLERRACTVPCMDYAKEHSELPPGVTINSIRKLHVTKPTGSTP